MTADQEPAPSESADTQTADAGQVTGWSVRPSDGLDPENSAQESEQVLVVVHTSSSYASLAMSPDQAEALGHDLIEQAVRARVADPGGPA